MLFFCAFSALFYILSKKIVGVPLTAQIPEINGPSLELGVS